VLEHTLKMTHVLRKARNVITVVKLITFQMFAGIKVSRTQAIELIYGHRHSKPSARIERWVLRLRPYTFQIDYKPGEQNPEDYP